MGTSNRVDVVVAGGESMAGWEDLADVLGDPVQAVDVAPDPNRRIIVFAPSKKLGRAQAVALGITPVAIVTPRTLEASRGIVADEVVVAPGLTAEEEAALATGVAPSLATTGGA